jgi:hypothetical protein
MRILKRFLTSLAFFVSAAQAQTTDTLTWMNTQLPAKQFIGVNGQLLQADGTWKRDRIVIDPSNLNGPTTLMYQPFRSTVNFSGHQIYWRKDESRNLANSWYGEIWNYDASNIYLHTETFPTLPGTTPVDVWDQRIDRFRLFVSQADKTHGRIMAPRTISSSWSTSGTLNTYMCGISKPAIGYTKQDGFLQVNAGQCPLYQNGVIDALVNMQVINGWNAYEPGMSTDNSQVQLPANTTFVSRLPLVWDAVLVINQYTPWPQNGVAGYARERFIMGYHQGIYYGMISWDLGWGVDYNHIQVTARAVPETILSRTTGTMDVVGMMTRSQRDRTLAPAGMPTNPTATCIANSNKVLLQWTGVAGEAGSDVRVDDLIDGWLPGTSANDVVVNNYTSNSIILDTVAGHRYNWWVHASNQGGESDPQGAPAFVGCASIGDPTVAPTAPTGLQVQTAGDIATLSWNASYSATSYDVRIDDLTDSWQPYVSLLDQVINNWKGTSYVFKMTPGHTYRWWVHANNVVGQNLPASATATFNYVAP